MIGTKKKQDKVAGEQEVKRIEMLISIDFMGTRHFRFLKGLEMKEEGRDLE